MRRAAAVLLSLVVLPLLAQPPEPSEKVVKKLSRPVVEMLKNVESVEAFRVQSADFAQAEAKDRVGMRLVVGEGKKMPKEFRDKLIAALFLDNTYYNQDSKGTSVGVGYRIVSRDGGRVEISCCLAKGNLLMTAFDPSGKLLKKADVSGFREDRSNPLRFLAAEAFPADDDIRKINALRAVPPK